MLKKHTHIYLLLLTMAALLPAHAQEVQPTWQSINQRGYPQWFQDAKLGIFIHWGLYSVPASSTAD